MTKNLVRNKRALSPVIATVILISVTIVVAVSVAYWMGSIAGGYTAFEQVELPTTYARYDSDLFGASNPGWNVTIDLKNTGSADATLNNVFINSIPLRDYGSAVRLFDDGTEDTDLTTISIPITKGDTKTLLLLVQEYDSAGPTGVEGATSGTRIDIKLHSSAGMDYIAQVKLP